MVVTRGWFRIRTSLVKVECKDLGIGSCLKWGFNIPINPLCSLRRGNDKLEERFHTLKLKVKFAVVLYALANGYKNITCIIHSWYIREFLWYSQVLRFVFLNSEGFNYFRLYKKNSDCRIDRAKRRCRSSAPRIKGQCDVMCAFIRTANVKWYRDPICLYIW